MTHTGNESAMFTVGAVALLVSMLVQVLMLMAPRRPAADGRLAAVWVPAGTVKE